MQNFKSPDKIPKISVIIPTFNRALMLIEAIDSVISQDYKNWELIIIDNFSTDETDKILSTISDVRIRSVKKPRTGSVAASRNLGIKMATGDWIAFLDSDDLWDPAKLSTVVSLIASGYDFIYHPLRTLDLQNPRMNHRLPRNIRVKSPIYMNLLLKGNTISLSSVVVKKLYLDTIGGMNESKELYALEDYDTWLRISRLTEKFFCIPIILGSYRVHGSNISNDNSFTYVARGLESHLRYLSKQQKRRFDGLYIYKEVVHQIEARDYKHILKKLVFALRYAPARYSVRLLARLLPVLVMSAFTRQNIF